MDLYSGLPETMSFSTWTRHDSMGWNFTIFATRANALVSGFREAIMRYIADEKRARFALRTIPPKKGMRRTALLTVLRIHVRPRKKYRNAPNVINTNSTIG